MDSAPYPLLAIFSMILTCLQWFIYIHLFYPHLTISLSPFPRWLPVELLRTHPLRGGLKPPPVSRSRGAYPHPLQSMETVPFLLDAQSHPQILAHREDQEEGDDEYKTFQS